MIEALYIVAEDAIRRKAGVTGGATNYITEGQPVALNASGELVGATAGDSVWGVSKLDSNQYRDFAAGEVGAFGTGQLTVVTKGTVRIKNSSYSGIEVTQLDTESSEATVQLLADVTFAVNDAVYVGDDGLITTAGVSGGTGAPFGRVLAPMTSDGWLEIEVDNALSVA